MRCPVRESKYSIIMLVNFFKINIMIYFTAELLTQQIAYIFMHYIDLYAFIFLFLCYMWFAILSNLLIMAVNKRFRLD